MKSPYFTATKIEARFVERIPYWFSPDRQSIRTHPLDHALFAIEHYKKQRLLLNPEQAIDKMINEGWVRVQVFPDGHTVIQGTPEALKNTGQMILEIVPDLKSVGIAYVPWNYKEPPTLSRKEIDKIDWDKVIDTALKIGKFANKI